MAIAWIQQFYNDTQLTFWFRSIDSMHNGNVGGVNLDGGDWHEFPGPRQYPATWCAIPWANGGNTYKDLTSDVDKRHILRFWNDQSLINFADGMSGLLVGQIVPEAFNDDINLDLSITQGGIYLEFFSAVGPVTYFVIDSNGTSRLATRDELASVLGTVAGGTIHLAHGRKRRPHAPAEGKAGSAAQHAQPNLAREPQDQPLSD